MGVEVPQQNYGVPSWSTFQHPSQGLQEGWVLHTAVWPISRNNSETPIPGPNPLVYWGRLQHMAAELGGYKHAHPSPTPLTMGHSREEEGPTSLKELSSRLCVEASPTISSRVWVVGAPAHDCYPKHTAPDPAPSCGWWAYGKVGLHLSFELCPAESRRQKLGQQALTCVPQPQAWLQGGAPVTPVRATAKPNKHKEEEAKVEIEGEAEDKVWTIRMRVSAVENKDIDQEIVLRKRVMERHATSTVTDLKGWHRRRTTDLGWSSDFCASPNTDLQGAGGNWATVGRRSRGGRRVHRWREKRKGKSVGLRIGTLNVGTVTGKGRELTDMMERRKVDILCVQETRWKGSKARSIGAGFKLFYYGVDSKRNGVGVVLKEEFVRNVLEVKRVSDRVMSLKLEIEGVMLNVVSGYAPQVGCELEEKERFWSELGEVMASIPMGERVVIGADFNGHVGEGNRGDEEVMGKFGVKERNLEGQMVVDFAKRMDMTVVNTYFQKREEHRVTYKSGGRRTQVDYILCRRGNLKEISDCKVVVGESVARQHRMVVRRMTLIVCKKKRSKIEVVVEAEKGGML
ncbi:hypothetical protein QTP86_008270 [Hemibagrus guttatus]|nr:hypothetical protein QTP86_008270 [Hemibagrus guttatus]